MRIGFVAEPYEETNASGMGYVVTELLRNLIAEGKEHLFVVYSSKAISKKIVPGYFQNIIIPKGFVRQFLYFLFLEDNIDVLLFVAPLLPIVTIRNIKTVVICQELASQKIKPESFVEKIKALVRDRTLMPMCAARASVIAAASNATRMDLFKYYNVPERKIVVIYDGYQDLTKYVDSLDKVDNIGVPYFFFAGKVKYRKNVHGITAAFTIFKKNTHSKCKLIIAGDYGPGPYYERIMLPAIESGIEKDITFVGYNTGAKLYAYYKNALAVVFPSLNEGFGMPIIEAMSLGTPVITSNISSMVEAAGNAALLVDPYDIDDIAKAMEKVHSDTELRESLKTKGFERAKQFSWSKAAHEFLNLIERHAR